MNCIFPSTYQCVGLLDEYSPAVETRRGLIGSQRCTHDACPTVGLATVQAIARESCRLVDHATNGTGSCDRIPVPAQGNVLGQPLWTPHLVGVFCLRRSTRSLYGHGGL